MRKRLPESARQFIERIRNEPLEQLSRDVYFVVTGSSHAFGGDRSILTRELLASSPHIRIFTALCLLHGLNQKEVFEVYRSLPTERQDALDDMVKRLIAEEIEDQHLREPSTFEPDPTAERSTPISLSAEVMEIETLRADLDRPLPSVTQVSAERKRSR